MLRAATSIGANANEALSAQSNRDFVNKMSIAAKETRETLYWLRLLEALDVVKPERLQDLIREAGEILKILNAIILTSQRKEE